MACWLTSDGGKSWRNTSKGLWAAYMPPDQAENPNVQTCIKCGGRRLQPDRLYIQHHNAVFTSADGGQTWAGDFQAHSAFAVAVHPKDPADRLVRAG